MQQQSRFNPERVNVAQAKPFQGFYSSIIANPGLSLRSNPGRKLVNAFGVYQTNFQNSLTDEGFALPEEGHLIHIYTTSPRRLLAKFTP
jgi:hypothetical protein